MVRFGNLRSLKVQFVVLVVCLLEMSLLADESVVAAQGGEPYGVIYERNPFGLKPPLPPTPPAPVEEPPPPPSNISLTGISSLSARKKVFLIVTNPSDNSQDYLTLTEGQRKKGIEVLSIEPEEGVIKIKNGGKEETLTFETHGRKGSTPARPVRTAGGVMSTKGNAPGNVATVPTRQPVNGMVALGGRNGELRGGTQLIGSNGSEGRGAPMAGGVNIANRISIPTREVRTSSYSSPRTTLGLTETESMIQSPEESVIIMEAIRQEKASDINRGSFPPLPDMLSNQ